MNTRIATGFEVIIGSSLVIVGTALIAIASDLIAIRARLILVACDPVGKKRLVVGANGSVHLTGVIILPELDAVSQTPQLLPQQYE